MAMSDVSSAATSASDDDLNQCATVASAEPLDINDWLVVSWQAQFGT